MSNKTIDMFKIRQILQLYSAGRGSKFISKTTGMSRNTIKKYLVQFARLRLSVERVEAMSDGELATAFLIEKPKKESSRVIDLESLVAGSGNQIKETWCNQTNGVCRLYPPVSGRI